jgi:hypothetical protein
MGLFDDLLDGDHDRHNDRRDHRHRDHEHGDRGHRLDPFGTHALEQKARSLLSNKAFLLAAVVIVLLVIAAIVAFVLPLLGHALDYVDQNGVKGVLEGAQGTVDRVWEGSGGALPAEAGAKTQ